MVRKEGQTVNIPLGSSTTVMLHLPPQEKVGPRDVRQGGCPRQLGAEDREPSTRHLLPRHSLPHLPGLRGTPAWTSLTRAPAQELTIRTTSTRTQPHTALEASNFVYLLLNGTPKALIDA